MDQPCSRSYWQPAWPLRSYTSICLSRSPHLRSLRSPYLLVRRYRTWHSCCAALIACPELFFRARHQPEFRVLYDLVFLVFAVLMTRVARTRNELEVRVAELTAELTRSNDTLRREIAERNRAEYLTSQVFESSPDAVSIVGTDYRYKRVIQCMSEFGEGPPRTSSGRT